MMPSSGVAPVQQWHAALNAGDLSTLRTLVTPDVVLGGPRGSITGAAELLAWVERARVTLIPQRYFRCQDTVVVQQLGRWLTPGADQPVSEQSVASVFTVDGGRVSSIRRYDGLPAAFAAAGPGEWVELETAFL